MTTERWELVKSVFESALAVDPAERASFVAEKCAGDDEVRREVSSLLDSHEDSGEFLEKPVMSVKAVVDVSDAPTHLAGQRVGAYELVREIGRGGMGAVYLATRADNEFQKRVAIKLIRGGMESDFLIRRFRNERQILARLEHPNIARLIDGGTTTDGLPYFVMEYVEGEPLSQYCEERSLPLPDRLEIFLKACSAVQYAHRRMIIHRDLKPGNILVKQDATPKLLDFGIAKLLDPDTSGAIAETTMGGVRIATPAYASPEQMRGEAATARSDIYALGIILFELLTGRRPAFGGGEDPLALPDAPGDSKRQHLARQLRAVVHKAVQPDPKERYESVDALAADIKACLAGTPVPNYAGAPTAYEAVTQTSPGSIAVLPFRLLGSDTTQEGYLGLGITDALITKLSNVGRISVRSTSAVMKFAASDALVAGRELGVEYVLEGRIQKAGDRVRVTVQLVHLHTETPEWAASFEERLDNLLRVEDSISEQVAQALVPQLTGEERRKLARAGTFSEKAHQAYLRGRWHWNKGNDESLAQALISFMQAIAEDPEYARAHAGVADYYIRLGIRGGLPPQESFAAARDAAATALKHDSSLAEAHASLGFAMWAYDRDYAAAAHEFQLAIALNPDYAPAHHWLGLLNSSRGRPEMAIACLERASKLEANRALYQADLAQCYYNARRYAQAIECCHSALRKLGDDCDLYSILAQSQAAAGQIDRAVNAAKRAAALGGQDLFTRTVQAEIEAAAGNRAPAKSLLEELAAQTQTVYVSGCVLAVLYLALGQREKALGELEHAWRDRDWWAVWLGVGPRWDSLRSERRFMKLVRAAPLRPEPSVKITDAPAIEPPRPKAAVRLRWAGLAAAVVVLVAAAPILYVRLHPRPAPFRQTSISKLTTNGIAMRAAISPDGRFVAYTSNQDGKPVIWVRELNGSAAYKVAGPLAGDIRSLEFIRDGRYVAFIVYLMNEPAKGVLYAAPIAGGGIEKLMADVPGPLSVSTDGTRIAYYRANPAAGRDDLFVRETGGTAERRIASERYPDRFSWNAGPAWSRDAKQLACAVERSDPSGFRVALTIVGLDGTMRPVRSPRWQWVGRLEWVDQNSGLIAIGQDHGSSFQQIYYVPARRGEAVRITNDLNDYNSLSVVPGGSALVSVQVQTLTNVYILRPDDPSHGKQVTPGSGRYFDLAWTPDGKLAYASDGSGTADIWMMAADGSGQQRLIYGDGRNYAPVVSPDGTTIAFHSNRDGNWNIWTLRLDTRALTQLTKGTRDSNWPQFSNDGAHVLFHHAGLSAMFNIWQAPVGGGPASQLTTALTMHPAVSPKDGRIASWYSADVAKPQWKIAVFAPNGGEPLKTFDVSSTVTPDSPLRWTPRGDAITYVDDRNGVSNIWLLPVDGKPARPLTSFAWGQVYSFDWSKDGRLAYSRGMNTNDVVLIRDTNTGASSGWIR